MDKMGALYPEEGMTEAMLTTRRDALFSAVGFASAALPTAALAASGLTDHPETSAARAPSVDQSIPIPPLEFDHAGQLIVRASATSAVSDFDYLVGRWRLRNRKLTCRLNGCVDWTPVFDSYVEMEKILGGAGNTDKYVESRNGNPFYGFALRLFDPGTRLWSIYWADGGSGSLGSPVVGSFDRSMGHFFGPDAFNGRPIIVVFRWDVRNPQLPVWSQAFSVDRGRTWEWNSVNVSERIS